MEAVRLEFRLSSSDSVKVSSTGDRRPKGMLDSQ